MGVRDTLELTLKPDEPLEKILEAVMRETPSKRLVVKVGKCNDRVAVIERLRDFLATNISRTVIIYVE